MGWDGEHRGWVRHCCQSCWMYIDEKLQHALGRRALVNAGRIWGRRGLVGSWREARGRQRGDAAGEGASARSSNVRIECRSHLCGSRVRSAGTRSIVVHNEAAGMRSMPMHLVLKDVLKLAKAFLVALDTTHHKVALSSVMQAGQLARRQLNAFGPGQRWALGRAHSAPLMYRLAATR
jgi:hypothetical protein